MASTTGKSWNRRILPSFPIGISTRLRYWLNRMTSAI